MIDEAWRAVPGFEGAYEVSNYGRVRSKDRAVWQRARGGRLYPRAVRGFYLRPHTMPSGHRQVMLGRKCNALVHRLVLAAFVGPAPDGMEVRHLNGKAGDNRLTNLAYGTRSQNSVDKKWTSENSGYRLRPPDVVAIKAALATGSYGIGADLARRFGVTQSTISGIKHGACHNDI